MRKHGGGVIGGSRYLAGIEDSKETRERMEECRGVQSSVHPGFNRTSGKAEEPAGYSVLSGPHLPTTILTDGPPPLQGGLGTACFSTFQSPASDTSGRTYADGILTVRITSVHLDPSSAPGRNGRAVRAWAPYSWIIWLRAAGPAPLRIREPPNHLTPALRVS